MGRPLAALLLATLLVFSGCSLLDGPAATESDPGTASPSAEPTRTPAPYPPGYGAAGVVDPDAASEAHASGVLDRESFVVEYNGTAFTNGTLARISSVQTANLSTDRGYVITRVRGRGTAIQYYEDGSVYVRRDPPGENDTTYETRAAPFRPREFTGLGFVDPLIRHVEYGEPERIPREGGTFFRYRGTEVTDVQAILGSSVDPANVSDVEVGIVVGPSGIVHRSAYRATVERGGETLRVSIEINVLGFRSTSVDRPDWFDEARDS